MILASTFAICLWAASGEKEISQPIEPTARSEHEQLLDPEERRKNRFGPPPQPVASWLDA